jgi:DNA-binding NarL/FixJ family response regulator
VSELPTPAQDRIGVLICDDVDELRLLIRVVIELDPELHVAGEARNGVEAIAQAERLQPDVILLDLSMPVLSGLEALPRLTAAAPAARVIAFTALSDTVVKAAVVAAGAHAFLGKGIPPDEITAAIKAAYATTRSSASPVRADPRHSEGPRRETATPLVEG